jgi:hypothetical protein
LLGGLRIRLARDLLGPGSTWAGPFNSAIPGYPWRGGTGRSTGDWRR